MLKLRLVAVVVLAAAATAQSLAATAQIRAGIGANVDALRPKVSLGCAIEIEKVAVITNTTTGTIAPGTVIHFNAVLTYPDGTHHFLRDLQSPQLGPGQSFRLGLEPMLSCSATYDVTLEIAP